MHIRTISPRLHIRPRFKLRLLAIVFALLAPLLIAACGGGDATSTPADGSAAATESPPPTAMPEPTAMAPESTAAAMPEPTAMAPEPTTAAMPEPTAMAPEPTPDAMPGPTAMPAMEMALAPSTAIVLWEMNGSGQSGWATLNAAGDQTEAVLWLSDGTLETELVHIHFGQCDALGGVAHDLTDFTDGSGSSVTMVDGVLTSLMTGGFAVNAHEKGNPGVYTACGNIPFKADSTTIALKEMNGSGQTGWATLTAMGGQTQVALMLSEGSSETELVHIHEGQCDTLGDVAHALTNFVDGSGTSVTMVDGILASLTTGGFAVNSHKKGDPGIYTACGNIAVAADSITIALGAMNDSGQSGWATLTAMGDQTEVVLLLGGGALESELVHIHLGQCDNLGGVAHALTDFADGSGTSVTMVDGALATLMTGGFAVNAHRKGDPGVYTACGNIPAKSNSIALGEMNESGQSGWAMLTAMGDQTEVVLWLSAGTLQTELVHIHEGQCDTLGGVAHALTDFADGSGSSVTMVDVGLASLMSGGFAINAHQKDDAGVYTACGNIPAKGDSVTIALWEMNESGQSGWATLNARGEQTEVVLTLSAGVMDTEQVHIHDGQCDTLGGVAHALTDFAGGSGPSVTMVDASLASLLTGGFAVNAHQKADPGVYTACGDIPVGAY